MAAAAADMHGFTPLYVAVDSIRSLELTVWLLDVRGADVNGAAEHGFSPLHWARTLDVLTALLDRGADPILLSDFGLSPLTLQACYGTVEMVARLLQDPRVRANVNVQDNSRRTAFHLACGNRDKTAATAIIHLLLQSGGNPDITNEDGQTPLAYLQHRHPSHHATIALLEQYLAAQQDAEKASLLVKARRLIVVSRNVMAPSYIQGRVAGGQPLPQVQLLPMVGSNTRTKQKERRRCTLMAFSLGMEGGWENAGMPRDVFRVVLDLLMPTWDPLRRKSAGTAPPLAQG